MGKISLITKEQQIILDEVKQNEFLRSQFYFTGGTALSVFYLHHRYSDDLDLFFLLQQYSLWDLVEGIRIKFKIAIEPFILGADLLKVEDFDYLPKMIKPLDLRELKSFFREKAKELGRQVTI